MPNENTTQNPTPYDEILNDPDQVNENEVGETNESEGTSGQGQTPAEKGNDGKPKQDRKTNAEYAARRREAEAKEKAEKQTQERLLKERELKGFIEGSGGTNTYIEQPIEDEEDRHLFELMKKADAAGKDPVKEGYRLLREERMESKKKLEEEASKQAKEKEAQEQAIQTADKNIKELQQQHPECDAKWFKEQWADEESKFKQLILHGFTPLQAYDFLGMKAKQPSAKTDDKTPSLQASGQSQGKKAVKDMSVDEVAQLLKDKYGGI